MEIKTTIDMNFNFRDLNIDNIVQRELADSAHNIEEQAKNNAPVDTGRLRASITADVKGLEANIGTDVEYASYVHDGTYEIEPQPFLYPVADGILEGIEDRIADDIARLL